MKNFYLICLMITCIVVGILLHVAYEKSQGKTSVEQLNECKKPCVVFTMYRAQQWNDFNSMTLRDSSGNIVVLNNDILLPGLLQKYTVGQVIVE